jgi:hypothetical protein
VPQCGDASGFEDFQKPARAIRSVALLSFIYLVFIYLPYTPNRPIAGKPVATAFGFSSKTSPDAVPVRANNEPGKSLFLLSKSLSFV